MCADVTPMTTYMQERVGRGKPARFLVCLTLTLSRLQKVGIYILIPKTASKEQNAAKKIKQTNENRMFRNI